MKNLQDVPVEEQKAFLNSFDNVLCDMDGVIWLSYNPIPGAHSAINNLKKVGKKLIYVTNSPFTTLKKLKLKMTDANFDSNDDVVIPVTAIINYLKSINFQKKIYCIGSTSFKEDIKNAGYTVVPDPPSTIGETFQDLLQHAQDDKDIGAVIMVYDFNLTQVKIQKALTHLKRDDCLLFIGGDDRVVPVAGDLGPVIAYHHLFRAVEEISGKNPIQLSKPSIDFAKFILSQYNIRDPKEVLFIGDSIDSDMNFATKAGFKKLLVLTGITKAKDVSEWKYPESYKPDFYVESMDCLGKILQNVYEIN